MAFGIHELKLFNKAPTLSAPAKRHLCTWRVRHKILSLSWFLLQVPDLISLSCTICMIQNRLSSIFCGSSNDVILLVTVGFQRLMIEWFCDWLVAGNQLSQCSDADLPLLICIVWSFLAEVCGLNVVILFHRMAILARCMTRLVVKNRHQNDRCYGAIWLSSTYRHHCRFNIEQNGEV